MGSFMFDSTGVKDDSSFSLLPDGWYPFRIAEAEAMKSKSGFPMILAKCKCIDPRHPDVGMIWHYVVFLPKGQKGDGMNVHFRKCIGVPFEGNIRVDSEEWQGKTFMGKVETEEYNGKSKNKIALVSPIKAEAKVEDEIPF